MANLVVVGHHEDLHTIVQLLRDAGHAVTAAKSGAAGYAAALRGADMAIIDQRLNDMRGTELCGSIRAHEHIGRTPIIMLVEVGDEIDRVVALEVGADDVVARPISLRELSLRVRAVLRRQLRAPVDERGGAPDFSIDADGHRVLLDGREVLLSALELRLLMVLYQQRGRVQTRQRLLDEVWGDRPNVSSRTVDACVKRLRHKLGHSGHLVETVRSVGYRFARGSDSGGQAPDSSERPRAFTEAKMSATAQLNGH